MAKDCPKCGGSFASTTPTLVAYDAGDDSRIAYVQIKRKINFVVNGVLRSFFPAERINLNFSLIRAMEAESLAQQLGAVVIFLNRDERDLFYA